MVGEKKKKNKGKNWTKGNICLENQTVLGDKRKPHF